MGKVIFFGADGLYELRLAEDQAQPVKVVDYPRATSPDTFPPAVGGLCVDDVLNVVLWTENPRGNGPTEHKLWGADLGSGKPVELLPAVRDAELMGCTARDGVVYMVGYYAGQGGVRLHGFSYSSPPLQGNPSGPVKMSDSLPGFRGKARGCGMCLMGGTAYFTRVENNGNNVLHKWAPPGAQSPPEVAEWKAFGGWITDGILGYAVCDEKRSRVVAPQCEDGGKCIIVSAFDGSPANADWPDSPVPFPTSYAMKGSYQPTLAVAGDVAGRVYFASADPIPAAGTAQSMPLVALYEADLEDPQAFGHQALEPRLLYKFAAGDAAVSDPRGLGPVVWRLYEFPETPVPETPVPGTPAPPGAPPPANVTNTTTAPAPGGNGTNATGGGPTSAPSSAPTKTPLPPGSPTESPAAAPPPVSAPSNATTNGTGPTMAPQPPGPPTASPSPEPVCRDYLTRAECGKGADCLWVDPSKGKKARRALPAAPGTPAAAATASSAVPTAAPVAGGATAPTTAPVAGGAAAPTTAPAPGGANATPSNANATPSNATAPGGAVPPTTAPAPPGQPPAGSNSTPPPPPSTGASCWVHKDYCDSLKGVPCAGEPHCLWRPDKRSTEPAAAVVEAGSCIPAPECEGLSQTDCGTTDGCEYDSVETRCAAAGPAPGDLPEETDEVGDFLANVVIIASAAVLLGCCGLCISWKVYTVVKKRKREGAEEGGTLNLLHSTVDNPTSDESPAAHARNHDEVYRCLLELEDRHNDTEAVPVPRDALGLEEDHLAASGTNWKPRSPPAASPEGRRSARAARRAAEGDSSSPEVRTRPAGRGAELTALTNLSFDTTGASSPRELQLREQLATIKRDSAQRRQAVARDPDARGRVEREEDATLSRVVRAETMRQKRRDRIAELQTAPLPSPVADNSSGKYPSPSATMSQPVPKMSRASPRMATVGPRRPGEKDAFAPIAAYHSQGSVPRPHHRSHRLVGTVGDALAGFETAAGRPAPPPATPEMPPTWHT